MKHHKIALLSTLMLALLPIGAWAQQRTVGDAQNLASNILGQRNAAHGRAVKGQFKAQLAATSSELMQQTGGEEAFYVFNAPSEGGFAIISADMRMEPVLGYCDEGNFDANNIPAPLADLLKAYQEEQQYRSIHPMPAQEKMHLPINGAGVEPLITTAWNVTAPYNKYCPPRSTSTVSRPCGETDVAVAQLMNYYRHINQGKGENYYQFEDKQFGMNFEEVTFDWNNLLGEYKEGQYNEEQADAVAKLIYACAMALNSPFSTQSGTPESSKLKGLIDHLGFDEDMVILFRDNVTDERFLTLILEELNAKRPVLFGHRTRRFLVDGYKDDGTDNPFLHVNWGWGGTANGYYKLTGLSPIIYDPENKHADKFDDMMNITLGVYPDNNVKDFDCYLQLKYAHMEELKRLDALPGAIYYPSGQAHEIAYGFKYLENWSFKTYDGLVQFVFVGPDGYEFLRTQYHMFDFQPFSWDSWKTDKPELNITNKYLPANAPIGEYKLEVRFWQDGAEKPQVLDLRSNTARFIVYDSSQPFELKGDLNGNNLLDYDDLELLLNYFMHRYDSADGPAFAPTRAVSPDDPMYFDPTRADLDGDGEITIADVTILGNLMYYGKETIGEDVPFEDGPEDDQPGDEPGSDIQPGDEPTGDEPGMDDDEVIDESVVANATIYIEDFRCDESSTIYLDVKLKTDSPITGAEFKMKLADGIYTLGGIPYYFNRSNTLHEVYDNHFNTYVSDFCANPENNEHYFIVNTAAAPDELFMEEAPTPFPVMDDVMVSVYLGFDRYELKPGYYPVTLSEIVLTDLAGHAIKVPDQSANICYKVPVLPVGITNTKATEQKEETKYDLQGRKVNEDRQGVSIQIQDNRKQVIRK